MKEIIIPSVDEFEKTLFEISKEANLIVNQLYANEKAKGNVDEDGWFNDEIVLRTK